MGWCEIMVKVDFCDVCALNGEVSIAEQSMASKWKGTRIALCKSKKCMKLVGIGDNKRCFQSDLIDPIESKWDLHSTIKEKITKMFPAMKESLKKDWKNGNNQTKEDIIAELKKLEVKA